jgi:nicotinate-nucleotide--dimethylbenzimidazole phosphoribosyltransferase
MRPERLTASQFSERPAMTRPLDDFRALLQRLPALDVAAGEAVRELFDANRAGESRLGGVAALFARVPGARPAMSRPSLALFAGTHGIAKHGVSTRRMDATLATVAACGSGDAPVNHLCAANMIGLKVYDLALHLPTGDISREAAMDERTAAATMAFGMEAIAGGTDCLLVGSIGATGDETIAGALLMALHGGEPADWLPEADTALTEKRVFVIENALDQHKAALSDPLEILGSLSGREFAAMAGAILAARIEKVPVILDGVTALAAASALAALDPTAIAHCLLADASDGPARRAAQAIGLVPLLGDGLSAGEGTCAALATATVRDALALHAGFAAQARAGHHHH